jgi:hypothetical protein
LINADKIIRQAYYDALNGNISVSVYKEDVDPAETGNYVVVRLESTTGVPNNQSFITRPVVIIDIVTRFSNVINPDTVEDIDQEIKTVLKPLVTSVIQLDNVQLSGMSTGEVNYLTEDDGTDKYYRKIVRYQNRIVEI